MRCQVAVSEHSDPLTAALNASQDLSHRLKETGCDLAFLFLSPHYRETLDDLLKTIHQHLHPKVMIGCMGDGVIGGTRELEERPALSILGLADPNMRVFPFRLTPDFNRDIPVLEGWPEESMVIEGPQTCVLLADPFTTPVEDLFSRVEGEDSGIQLIGGLASGGRNQGDNRLILNQTAFDSGVVGVIIGGGVCIRTVVSQGCRPVGDRYVVTKAERNVLYELGGTSAVERLETTLLALPDEARRKAFLGIQVGIAMDEYRGDFGQGDFLIRGLLGADRESGSLVVGDFLREGQTIQFHIRDDQAASDDLRILIARERQSIPGSCPKGALLFSCNGRGQHFFAKSDHDISSIQEGFGPVPVAGFFAGGEFGPVGGKNYLHGYTASMALFYDP